MTRIDIDYEVIAADKVLQIIRENNSETTTLDDMYVLYREAYNKINEVLFGGVLGDVAFKIVEASDRDDDIFAGHVCRYLEGDLPFIDGGRPDMIVFSERTLMLNGAITASDLDDLFNEMLRYYCNYYGVPEDRLLHGSVRFWPVEFMRFMRRADARIQDGRVYMRHDIADVILSDLTSAREKYQEDPSWGDDFMQ